MSLLEELSAKGAPSRQFYDDDDADFDDALTGVPDPTTVFPLVATEGTLPASVDVLLFGEGVGAHAITALAAQLPAAACKATLTLTYPRPYAAHLRDSPLVASLPVYILPLSASRTAALVPTDALHGFPPELFTAFATSLTNPLQPKRVVALTSSPLALLPRSDRAYDEYTEVADDRAQLKVLRNPAANAVTSPRAANVAPMRAPSVVADLAGAVLIQATLAKVPATILTLYTAHVRGAPEVTRDAVAELLAGATAEAGIELDAARLAAAVKAAEIAGVRQADKFSPMYQ
ncbi:hypothetical protein H9P43_005507 [Blastocladiella emersonii ATCC 22665]|nr:hypothetical protein H9P43_005507 [Blastocladiella emersonii ATCC 22665]